MMMTMTTTTKKKKKEKKERPSRVRLAINLPWEHRICTTQPCTRVQWALGNCDGRCRDARAPVGNKRASLINSIHRPSWRFSDYRGSGDFWHSFATLESLPERLTSNWNVIFYSPRWCTEGKIKYGCVAPAELIFLSAEKVTSMECKVTTTEEQRLPKMVTTLHEQAYTAWQLERKLSSGHLSTYRIRTSGNIHHRWLRLSEKLGYSLNQGVATLS
jgi:hypothetical protein